jgi:hypothetical protein
MKIEKAAIIEQSFGSPKIPKGAFYSRFWLLSHHLLRPFSFFLSDGATVAKSTTQTSVYGWSIPPFSYMHINTVDTYSTLFRMPHKKPTRSLVTTIYPEGVKNAAAGCNPMNFRRGVQAAVDCVVDYLSKHVKTLRRLPR